MGIFCPILLGKKLTLFHDRRVSDKYLFELEKNLTLQANSLLLQKDDRETQHQIRVEFNQLSLIEKFKANIEKDLIIGLGNDYVIHGKLIEVNIDHVVIVQEIFKYFLNYKKICFVQGLENTFKKLNHLESKWNFKSLLNQKQNSKKVIHFEKSNQFKVQGLITNIFMDHITLRVLNEETIINLDDIILIKEFI